MKTTQAVKQNAHPSFTIYDASAGSGKTYSLVRSYLQAILHTNRPENYQSILAITFTNKAAHEMKTRVLIQLKEFSSKKILLEPTEMFQEIVKQCGVDNEVVHQRAAKVLHHILQNYGHFSITTIDSLTHQIVRTFARDLGLSSTFEVMLETDFLLEQAVDLLIEQTGENKQQTKILTDFVIQKASDNKSWDVRVDLNNIAPLVYNENHYNQLRQMNDKSWNDFLTLQKKIQIQKTLCVEATNKGSEQLYKKVIDSGIEEGSFSYKELIKQLQKGQSSNPTSIPSKRLLSLNENNQILNKSASQSEHSALASMQGDIDQWIEIVTLQQKTLNLLQLIDKQRVPFSALHAIYKTAQDLQKNQDKRLLSSFNPLLFETISELPTPFVYERLGVKYSQIFIDEFQDTSLLQWKNLIPLLDNVISRTDSSILLVGDAKQSIYRWRGGYPEQFIDLTKGITPFPIDPEVIRLPKNYRSQDMIVKTNNTFFKESAAVLSSTDYQNLFKKGADQETSNNPGGAVTFTFVKGDTVEEREPNYLEAIHQQLIDCENRKYKRNEICILVRTRQQGVRITEYLAQQKIYVISAETLLLSESRKVNVLLGWLQLRINQNDEEARKVILDYFLTDDQDQFIWHREGLKKPIHQFVKQINSDQYDFSFERFLQKGIYEAVEYTIDTLNMTTALCPYMSGFLEEIIDFTRDTAT
ncbi:MAG: UvrD-helicase domain-containing protein, partial [Bacteroidota bacterium]|nr:UvrD-helicase domain-containing protein [Bacteroidota bacterium]